MQVNVNIILSPEDPDISLSPDEIADALLENFKGNGEKDTVAVFIHRQQVGRSGLKRDPSLAPPEIPPPVVS